MEHAIVKKMESDSFGGGVQREVDTYVQVARKSEVLSTRNGAFIGEQITPTDRKSTV